jgi:hypothetical protein
VDPDGAAVRIYEVSSSPETQIACSLAGVHLAGGQATGVAPGAALVIAQFGYSLGMAIEGFVSE